MARTYETETVVLLESSPFWLEAVSGIVEEIGFSRVLSADSATQALALIEQSRPSLFLYGLAESGDSAWDAYLAMLAFPTSRSSCYQLSRTKPRFRRRFVQARRDTLSGAQLQLISARPSGKR